MTSRKRFLAAGLLTAGLLVGLVLILAGNTALATATPGRAAALPVVDDFEAGLPGGWFQYGDYGSGTAIATNVVATDTVPGAATGNHVLEIVYTSAGWGAGTGRNIPGEDWSLYDGLAFWFFGSNSGGTYRVILSDNPNPDVPGDSAERFAYEFKDNAVGWRYVLIPWGAFFRDYAYQPGGAPDDGLTLTQVQAYALALPAGTRVAYVDDVRLVKFQVVDDFEAGLPAGWFQYGDYGSGTAIATNVVATDTVPGAAAGNHALEIAYTSAGWGGGTGKNLPGPDWTPYSGFGFWFFGSNSGGVYRVILSDNPNPAVPGDSAERFAYEFSDNLAGWRFIAIPWAAFFRDYAYQPGGAPDDGLTLTQVQAYALALPGGTRTTYLDHVTLFGAGEVPVTVGFDPQTYNAAAEGQPVTLTVALNVAAGQPVTVTWATADGTALAGSDYISATGQVVFAAGETAKTIVVQTLDDTTDEDAETFTVALSAPEGATLGSKATATVTIPPSDKPVLSGNSVIVDDFEDGLLPSGQDANGIGVGFVTWNAPGASAAITVTDAPPAPVPGSPAGNKVLKEDLTIASGQWAGFTHAFTNAAADTWTPQDWSKYVGVSFWLYGNNTGGTLFVDLLDNRKPGSTTDDAERWSVDIPDNFTGWRFFQFAWADFHRKEIGNGAPNDGLGLTEVHGYAIGGYGSVNMGSQSYYLDDFGLLVRTTVIDDFEDGLLPSGQDANEIGVGFVTWNAPGASAAITVTDAPPAPVPGLPAGNKVLKEELTIGPGQWAGFTHAFTNAAADTWTPQDWSTYEGISFWLYGNNTGGTLFMDLLDNRKPGSTTDDAERWSIDIPDNFTGWKFIRIPFKDLHRKEIGNDAPNDGLGLTEVHGYAIGGYGSVNMGSQSYYVDQVAIYGNTGTAPKPLQVAFARADYRVTEGATAVVTVSLTVSTTEPVTVTYRTAEGYAIPDRDYTPVSGTLTFLAGETSTTFTVATLDDLKADGPKTLMLNLADPVNAELGFQRQAVLTIEDNEAADPWLLDDFEGWHPFTTTGNVALSVVEVAQGDALALPGQGAYEQVLRATFDTAAGPAGFTRTYPAGQDWRGANGLTFWYYGSNSGQQVTVELLDNRGAPAAAAAPSALPLVWSDEFNDPAGTPPNPNVWSHEIGDGTLNGIPGWGNSELQFYNPANAATDGAGNLVIRAEALDASTDKLCWYGPCKYTSARLVTANKVAFQYGKIEARIWVPTGPAGLWPAFWMLGTNIGQVGWPQSGEIDIMEYVSRNPNEVFGTIHGPGYSGGNGIGHAYTFPGGVAGSYHTFSIEWAPDEIHWYVDGINYHNATPADIPAGREWVFNHPFYLLLNLALGGNFGGAVSDQLTFPQEMKVDYVRVYGADDTSERFTATFTDNFTGWRKVILPFRSFTRAAQQPAGAPDDGLTLSEVWGYGFRLPQGANGTFYLDQVRLADLWIRFMPLVARQ